MTAQKNALLESLVLCYSEFVMGWQCCYKGNAQEQLCQPEENSVLPDSFAQIYMIFEIGFFKLLLKFRSNLNIAFWIL